MLFKTGTTPMFTSASGNPLGTVETSLAPADADMVFESPAVALIVTLSPADADMVFESPEVQIYEAVTLVPADADLVFESPTVALVTHPYWITLEFERLNAEAEFTRHAASIQWEPLVASMTFERVAWENVEPPEGHERN